jgi:hypothetical protein
MNGHPADQHTYRRRRFRASTLLEHFARSKTVWTLPSLWTQRTRPQGTWKTAQTAVSTAPTPIMFFLEEEEKEQRRTLQVCQSDCLNGGVHPRSLCLRSCRSSRRRSGRRLPVRTTADTRRTRQERCLAGTRPSPHDESQDRRTDILNPPHVLAAPRLARLVTRVPVHTTTRPGA